MTTRIEALAWYPEAYSMDHYRMGVQRKAFSQRVLYAVPVRSSMLDIGCGRGEMLDYAKSIGFDSVRGIETVDELVENPLVDYGLAHNLPAQSSSYDVVTMFDVMEHLIEEDCYQAIDEMLRVATSHIVVSISNKPSIVHGIDVHITKKRYDEWDRILRYAAPHAEITHLVDSRPCVCEMWRIDL